jgi:hypothetical protein
MKQLGPLILFSGRQIFSNKIAREDGYRGEATPPVTMLYVLVYEARCVNGGDSIRIFNLRKVLCR